MWSFGYVYIRGYGEISMSVSPTLDFSGIRYSLNGVSVTQEEAEMVQLAMRNAWTDELTAADFVDLKEVKKILEKVCTNNAV